GSEEPTLLRPGAFLMAAVAGVVALAGSMARVAGSAMAGRPGGGAARGDPFFQPVDAEAAAPLRPGRLGARVLLVRSHDGSLLRECGREAGPNVEPAARYLSLLGFVAGCSLGLLFPGACAGLPDGNCPGGKLAFDGAIRSSSRSIWKRPFLSATFSPLRGF